MIAGLPYDAEVEYLESTGTQWIDTRVIPTVHTGIETDIAITYAPYDLGAISGMCGSGLFAGGGSYSQYIYRTTSDVMTSYMWAFGSTGSFSISIPYGTRTVFGHNFLEDGVVRVDGVQKATLPSNPTLLQYPIALMKLNVANNTSDMRFYVKGRLYHVRISDGSIISHNFVPVRFTNELGQPEGALYDRVSRKLFRNAGTDSFTIGPDVATPVIGLHFMKQIPKYTAKSYVQDGLVAMWDGIENAGWLTHDANATTWKDLTGNGYDIDIPSSGAVWRDDKISLAATSLSTDLQQVNRTEFTIECVATGARNGSYVWMKNPSWVGGALVGQGVSFALWYPWASLGILGLSTWSEKNSIALTWKQSEQAGYLNGQKMLTSTGSIDGRNVLSKIYIGEYNGSICTTLDGHNFRLYSRALSVDEIAANYAIDKERFNLP